MIRRSNFLRGAAAVTVAALAGARPDIAASAPMPPAAITLGDEVFLSRTWRELSGRTIGIVTNQTGVTANLETIVDAVRRNPAIALRALYSPEHGLRGDRTAGAYVESYRDERTGLPVYSLYGNTRHPTRAMLDGVDVLLFDIQDVGDRAYTYISTLAYVMIAAKTYGKSVWVLDRPNPIGGSVVEGPVLDPHFASFVGLYPLPVRHGMTVGELAKLYNEHFSIGCTLRVMSMENYTRRMLWPDTGLHWVQTSPNIPEWDTTLVYPATGLLGAAGLNNGTGATKPFKYVGADGLDGARLAEVLNARNLPGVHFREAAWSPAAAAKTSRTLTGVELVVVDPHAFRAVRTAVEILVAVRRIAPSRIVVPSAAALDRDWGTDALRRGLDDGLDPSAILAQWERGTTAFTTLRERFFLYPE